MKAEYLERDHKQDCEFEVALNNNDDYKDCTCDYDEGWEYVDSCVGAYSKDGAFDVMAKLLDGLGLKLQVDCMGDPALAAVRIIPKNPATWIEDLDETLQR